MKAQDKLRATWSNKEDDLMYHYPLGASTNCDARLIHNWFSALLFGGRLIEGRPDTKNILDELDERGYDITTIRFSIEPKKNNARFASQRDENPNT